ncbi:MAG TPA: zinc dependent phospholipase C family protein [Flavisolibacter sp.]|nr:zinc dependent phospholipase C family protein [Flavisolibacter sp.]
MYALSFLSILFPFYSFAWGFYGHQKINYQAVLILPPQMMAFYKPHIGFLSLHAVDPDKRRYAVTEEGPRHYIDLDRYGSFPFDSLPKRWEDAVEKFGEDSLQKHGIVPWWVQVMYGRLVKAFREKDGARILKVSADIGHYIADAHVPLHTSSNHNGQLTGQHGIHGFWESRVPELLAEKEWDLFTGKADYIRNTGDYIWRCVLQSAAAVDSVLLMEKKLTAAFAPDRKYAFENRNGQLVKQYSSDFTQAYDRLLNGMIERRMHQSIHAIASFWYTAWVDAGQPVLPSPLLPVLGPADEEEFEWLNRAWRKGEMKGREE